MHATRLLTLFAALAVPSLALAGQTTLSPSKDNSIWNDPAGQTSGGASEGLYVGRADTQAAVEVRRALIAFDVAGSIPAGATITSAEVRMYVSMSGLPASFPMGLHRATQDWGESTSFSFGGKGAQAERGDTTWLHTFFNNQFWSSAGGDFLATASATTSVGDVAFYDWSSPQLIADVQDMLDQPGDNFGWLVRGNETTLKSAKRFESSETSFPSFAPVLTVEWDLAPESYCTAGTSANGCQALLSGTGTPSATAASGFTLDATGVEGQKDGLYFFAANGRQANSWGSGTSFQCVAPPVFRGGLLLGTGTSGACDGTFSQDLNARWQAKPNSNPGAGAIVQAQLWYRDPQNTSNQTTSLSDAVEFVVCP